MKEDMCGFVEVLHPPEKQENRIPPPVEFVEFREIERSNMNGSVLGGVLAAVFLILIIIIVVVACQMTKQKGDYKTQEAKGTENADNPDFAILQERSGQPEVSRKREIFI